jgi:hypothetical protein
VINQGYQEAAIDALGSVLGRALRQSGQLGLKEISRDQD